MSLVNYRVSMNRVIGRLLRHNKIHERINNL